MGSILGIFREVMTKNRSGDQNRGKGRGGFLKWPKSTWDHHRRIGRAQAVEIVVLTFSRAQKTKELERFDLFPTGRPRLLARPYR